VKIPVTYNNSEIGEVFEFDESTCKVSIRLNMDKDNAKLIKEMIMQNAPLSMSFYNEPAYANEEETEYPEYPEEFNVPAPPDNDIIEDGFGSAWSAWCPECNQKTMCVVRPGKCQCNNCG